MTEPVVTVLRGFPPAEVPSSSAPGRGRPLAHPRFDQRPAVVLHAAGRAGTVPESFGLGAALVVLGRSVLSGCILVPDDLSRTAPGDFARVKRWAGLHPIATTSGPHPWHVADLGNFFDPHATVEKEPSKPWAFQPTAYEGAGFVVGADLGRLFGLVAEHVVIPRGRRAGSWQVWLPGWGVRGGGAGNVRRRSPHRPCLYLRARRAGWQASWGPCGTDKLGKPAGKRDRDGRSWEGLFVDVLSLAYALDADRGASFAEHCEDFGLPVVDLPVTTTVDDRDAELVATAVVALHQLAVRLDDEAASWFPARQRR